MPSKQKVEEKGILFLDFELFIGGKKRLGKKSMVLVELEGN